MAKYDMKNDKCFLCGGFFGSNGIENSDEHIIPNALGGRLKLKSFICKSYNNITGYEWDGILCRNLENISLYAGVSRDRGKLPSRVFKSEHDENVEYIVSDNGGIVPRNFSIEKDKDSNQTRFNIRAKDKKMQKML